MEHMPGLLDEGVGGIGRDEDEDMIDKELEEEMDGKDDEEGFEDIEIGGNLFDDNHVGELVDLGKLEGEEGGCDSSSDEESESDEEDSDGDHDPVIYDDARQWEPRQRNDESVPAGSSAHTHEDPVVPIASGRSHVEEALRQPVFVKAFDIKTAGAPLKQARSVFTTYTGASKHNAYWPFASERDWLVARWAKLRGPGSTALDELLSIKGVSAILFTHACLLTTNDC